MQSCCWWYVSFITWWPQSDELICWIGIERATNGDIAVQTYNAYSQLCATLMIMLIKVSLYSSQEDASTFLADFTPIVDTPNTGTSPLTHVHLSSMITYMEMDNHSSRVGGQRCCNRSLRYRT
jgi:hypothetical protein